MSGGFDSRGYKDFREFAPELIHGDDSEGYATLLGLIFDDLATELPGLFGAVRLTGLVPTPASTLRHVIEQLNQPALDPCWQDDTTLGWIYQYWNDPEREALDAKLHDGKKLRNDEIASKTQMFTERYMVEWLLHNTLGPLWLAMCRKHGHVAEVERNGTLDRLAERRQAWRAKREAGEVALDALMPIETDEEQHWKYWVPQPMPDDAPDAAPERLRNLKLLDPACGSGHFLVIAFDLLFALYGEEASQRGESVDAAAIAESILEHNLHGIDIDARAVQIAAAALMLKCRQLAPAAQPQRLNLVAPQLRLASLPDDDPARAELRDSVERETGIPGALTQQVIDALAGADHLGSLLKVDAAIDAAIRGCEQELRRPGQRQQEVMFAEPKRPQQGLLTFEEARETLASRLDAFLAAHGHGDDLGLKLRGEQLSAGLRFVRLVREGQYDIVIGNPPYQGTSKMADAKYVAKHYPRGKADLYAAFLERGLQLVREGGTSALLTMRNWMFIKQYASLRQWLLETFDLRMLGDVDRGAFEEVPDEVVSAVMSVLRRTPPRGLASIAMQPTPLDDKTRDSERTKRKRAAVLCQVGRFEFDPRALRVVPEWPIVYWWSPDLVRRYAASLKLGQCAPVRTGVCTSDNGRFLRLCWEISVKGTGWVPYVSGGKGLAWIDPCEARIEWGWNGLRVKVLNERLYGSYSRTIQNEIYYMRKGIAYTPIGNVFRARSFARDAIIGKMGSSAFPRDVPKALCSMNQASVALVLSSINPGIHFEVGDVNRLPVWDVADANEIYCSVEAAFVIHESHREPSVEFSSPGPSPWRYAQDWAQRAVDRPEGEPLPPYEPQYDPEPPTDHLSFAIGVALGRFGANGEGILDQAPATALPSGILFLSAASNDDSLAHPAARPILDAWQTHGPAIDARRTLKDYLQSKFFPDVHRGMYENRPIYFPLSSERKSFVAWVSIHRWTAGTLRDLLAEHLKPALTALDGEIADLQAGRQNADRKAAKAAEDRYVQVDRWQQELRAFIRAVEGCDALGPPPADAKTPPREVDARYDPDLDDGVMINSAALWPLLEPQWKDPKKWWKELASASASGKKDYDWSHLAARYFPTRVDAKCRLDPSLGVAHGCFWKYHPATAFKWELRLKDEIGPDFTLDERDSNEARARFEREQPAKVAELVAAEEKRRERKRKKQDEADQDAAGDDEQPDAAVDEDLPLFREQERL